MFLTEDLFQLVYHLVLTENIYKKIYIKFINKIGKDSNHGSFEVSLFNVLFI